MQKIKGSIRNFQLMSKKAWGQVLQTVASVYRMVLHEATGMSPFLMLYGREALLPEEIEHTTYGSDSDYKKAVERHIGWMLEIQELASQRNSGAIQRSKEYFDRRYVNLATPYTFVVGDVVLMNTKKRLSDIKNVRVCWIGPCTVVYERPGKLYDIEYKCKGKVLKYFKAHPEFQKLYLGQVV